MHLTRLERIKQWVRYLLCMRLNQVLSPSSSGDSPNDRVRIPEHSQIWPPKQTDRQKTEKKKEKGVWTFLLRTCDKSGWRGLIYINFLLIHTITNIIATLHALLFSISAVLGQVFE